MGTSCLTRNRYSDPKYEEREVYQRCQKFLDDLGIKVVSDFDLRREIRCDYYGFNHRESIIIKRKQTLTGAEQGVFQLLKCYHEFKRTECYRNHYPYIKLMLFYDTPADLRKFLNIHSLCRDYLKGLQCPPVLWCYRDDNDKPIALPTQFCTDSFQRGG